MSKKFLDRAYDLEGAEDTRHFYQQWADSYDQEIAANGYASPLRTAQALAECGADKNAALLDIGCGTGLSGLFLQDAGFARLHGSDFSAGMLEQAREKQVYDELHLADLTAPFDFVTERYRTISAVGVMAPGHAGPELIETVIELLSPGGLFGFSLNDHSLDNPAYMGSIENLLKEKRVRVRWQEYGDHLPKIAVNAMIMVLQRRA